MTRLLAFHPSPENTTRTDNSFTGLSRIMCTRFAQLALIPACFLHPFTQLSLWHPPKGSLQLVGKAAIPARQAPLTNAGGWKGDLEAVLKGPLDRCLEARQADLPYVVFLDPDRMRWQEETPVSFPPDAYVYLETFFYTTDTLGRLKALGAFEVQRTPSLDDRPSLEEQITRLKDLLGIDEQTKIILLEETLTNSTMRKTRLN